MTDSEYSSRFFCNRACEYFPCHKGIAPDQFNCLFCYCPLYALGKGCGGNYRYLENGVKSCADCAYPHIKGNYDRILSRYRDIAGVVEAVDRALPTKRLDDV